MRWMLRCLISVLATFAVAGPAAAQTWITVEDASAPGDASPPPVGIALGAATMPAGDVGVFYGGQTDVASGSTWTFSAGGTWTAVCGTTTPATADCGPGVRVAPGMGTVPGGVAMYAGLAGVFGTSTMYGDTWLFDGATWSQVCTEVTCGPGLRVAHAMAGNGTVAVMFGGLGGSGLPADTWTFDGATWTAVCGTSAPPTPACGPSGRMAATMAWDGTRFVMVGGTDGAVSMTDTWTFDPGSGTWTEACASCGPNNRAYAVGATVRNAVRPGAVFAGGMEFSDPPNVWDDVWFWDESSQTWEELSVPWVTEGGPFPMGEQGAPDVCGVFLPGVASLNDDVMLFGMLGGSAPGAAFTRMGWDLSGTPYEPCAEPTTTTIAPATTTTLVPATTTTAPAASTTAAGGETTTSIGTEGEAAQSATPSGRLPSTGSPVLAVVAIGLAALGVGLLARRVARRRVAQG